MSIFSNNRNTNQAISQRQMLSQKYQGARSNLLLVLAFTLINIVLLFAKANTYFLFSAFVPYQMVVEGMYYCGKLPEEAYAGYYHQMDFLNDSFLYTMVAIAAIILVVYLLCWIFSKKYKSGWLIAALVFFLLDTLALVLMTYTDIANNIVDYVFHGWVIYSLISGISANAKLKALPEEEIPAPVDEYQEIEPVDEA